MEKKNLLFAAGIILLLGLVMVSIFLGVYTETCQIPENFVEEESLEHSEGFFIMNDIIRYPTKVNVTSLNLSDRLITVGVAAQTYELNFGNVPQNITVRKFINLRNNEDIPVRICILKRGDVSPFIHISQDNLILQSNETGEIEIKFNSTEVRTYSGEIDITVRKPKYPLLKYFMSLVRC